jgi:hypothetical protein
MDRDGRGQQREAAKTQVSFKEQGIAADFSFFRVGGVRGSLAGEKSRELSEWPICDR